MSNIKTAQHIISSLYANGVDEVCLCAGARNSPFVFVLQNSEGIKIHHFFEERSAAFFALGRIHESNKPVAVITTSGTAVAELLPAAVEATYAGLPLVLVTADRPVNYRGTGAPQSIDQVRIFSDYVEKCVDVEGNWDSTCLTQWSQTKPLQINVCIAEPLIDSPPEKLIFKRAVASPAVKAIDESAEHELKGWLEQISHLQKPLVILGSLSKAQSAKILPLVKKLKCPVYAEGLSHLRASMALEGQELRSGDEIVKWGLVLNQFDGIIRIGGVPTLRAWRDLEDKFSHIPVFSLSDLNFSGMSRKTYHCSKLSQLRPDHLQIVKPSVADVDSLMKEDNQRLQKLKQLLRKYPLSEPALMANLSWKIRGQSVYIGNSLPVRNWDWVATREAAPFRIFGNRGANGIDGQLSTFLGFAHEYSDNWAIVGDLTAMYDLTSLWAVKDSLPGPLRIVVVNNSGGQIFNRIFKNEFFLNTHNIQFSAWAAMWGWDYQKWNSIPDTFKLSPKTIIELRPEAQQTQQFQDEWEQVCRLI